MLLYSSMYHLQFPISLQVINGPLGHKVQDYDARSFQSPCLCSVIFFSIGVSQEGLRTCLNWCRIHYTHWRPKEYLNLVVLKSSINDSHSTRICGNVLKILVRKEKATRVQNVVSVFFMSSYASRLFVRNRVMNSDVK